MELYRINWKVQIWVHWRASIGKSQLKVSGDGCFLILSENEFQDYCKFDDSLKFLTPISEKDCVMLKEDELLKFYIKHTGVELFSKNMFGMKFYVLTWEELRSLANWIQSMLIRLSA